MINQAIIVENLSKRYRIGVKEKIHNSIGGAIASWIKSPLSNYRRLRSLSRFEENGKTDDIIWALRNVSFEVQEGEVLGIIGRNGAGKSTLLKILSQITDPTTGRIRIRGRVSSLLEVGTGFHPELTGRENIYLNGTILGMTKREVDRKFDEIVDFSGIEKFIDTPIKRYSTGMNVRLAFSIAAHLEPEVLIIDEVLAVGDAEFQKKCLGKMEGVAKKGRTVLFVSHNMLAVSRLCMRAMWLEDGMIKLSGQTDEVIAKYLSYGTIGTAEWVNNEISLSNDQGVIIESVRILRNKEEPHTLFKYGEPFKIEVTYNVLEAVHSLSISYQLYNSKGILIYESRDTDIPQHYNTLRERGKYKSICNLSNPLLLPDQYTISVVALIDGVRIIHKCENVLIFDVSVVEESGHRLSPWKRGAVSPVFNWEIKRLNKSKHTGTSEINVLPNIKNIR